MEKPNYYAVIPAEVRYNKKLTPNAKLLYAEITALCNMNGKCTASTQYFCKLYEVSRASIQNWLRLLEKNGYIIRDVIYRQGSKEILSRSITLTGKGSLKNYTDNTNAKAYTNTNITYSNKGKPTMSKLDQQINAWQEAKKLL
jgi:response regulator of citrate/malate metabolism